jgi:dTDP-4-amino-4,6-dideoxygalactose transaminase
VRAAPAERGVQTSVHYPPIHTFSAYSDAGARPLPRTDAVAGRLLTLPLYGGLSDEQVELLVEVS